MTLHQPCANRASHEPARDDAHHRGSHGQCGSAGNSCLREQWGESKARCRPTGEGYRPAKHTKQRVHSKGKSYQDSDEILREGHDGRDDKEQKHLGSANAEQRQAGTAANRSEERNHQGRLQRRVEADELDVAAAQDQKHHRGENASNHCGRNVVASQEWKPFANEVSGEQHDACDGDGLDEIEFEHALS